MKLPATVQRRQYYKMKTSTGHFKFINLGLLVTGEYIAQTYLHLMLAEARTAQSIQ
jgi:hypothetical protein